MKLAIFDFDGTIFMTQTLPFLLKQWKKQNLPKSKLYKSYFQIAYLSIIYKFKLTFIMSAETVRVTAFKKFSQIFEGMSASEIDDFFKQFAKEATQHFNQDVAKEIAKANENGFLTVILSGCYSTLLKYIAQELGVKIVIGTNFNYDDNNIFNLSHPLKVPSGKQKAISIREHFIDKAIDWQNSFAYADSAHDIHIFNEVGNPVAVCPDDTLRTIAEDKGWRIIE